MLGRYENMEAVEQAAKEAFPYHIGYGNAKVGDDVVAVEHYEMNMGEGKTVEGNHAFIGKVTQIDYLPMADTWRIVINVRSGSRTYSQVPIYKDSLTLLQSITYKPTFREA